MQTDGRSFADAETQTESPLFADAEMQTDGRSFADAEIQTESPLFADAEMQTDRRLFIDATVQVTAEELVAASANATPSRPKKFFKSPRSQTPAATATNPDGRALAEDLREDWDSEVEDIGTARSQPSACSPLRRSRRLVERRERPAIQVRPKRPALQATAKRPRT